MMNFFAKNIHFLRKHYDFTQAEMPARIDIGRATWSNYENSVSEPDIEKIIGISALFKVSIDALLMVDLSENVHLIGISSDENIGKNVHVNVHANVLEGNKLMVNEDQAGYALAKKGQIDLLILKQLNTIADDVKDIKAKLPP